MLKLNKAVSPRLSRLLVMDHPDGLDRTVGVELTPQLRLGCVLVNPGHKQGLERVLGRFVVGSGVPQGNLLLQLVSYLLLFVSLLTCQPETNKEVSIQMSDFLVRKSVILTSPHWTLSW